MALIPDHILDQIFESTDIVDLIHESVPLQKTGANFKACCPFHSEKSPSFVVSPQKQIFHCFGCGAGGNAIRFIMMHQGLGFRDAAEQLAERAGVTIPQTGQSPAASEKESLLKVNAYTSWFFKEEFRKSELAQNYCESRSLSAETIEKYDLGYAPDGFQNLIGFFEKKNIPEKLALTLGLIRPKKSGQGVYDFYRNRLVFPIKNRKGKVVGFGARALEADQNPKYINSSESLVYNKSRELYGLHEALPSIRKNNRVIIVEGYTDVLACSQSGVPETVAPLGTSLTSDQISILKRFTSNIILVFDGDGAGQKAALRALQLCLADSLHASVVLLPQGQDPGDWLQNPPEMPLADWISAQAQTGLSWIFAQTLKSEPQTPAESAKAIRFIKKWIDRLPDPYERAPYLRRLEQVFELPQNEKNLEITQRSTRSSPLRLEAPSLEELFVAELVQSPAHFETLNLLDISRGFDNSQLKTLVEEMVVLQKKHETFVPQRAIQELPESLGTLLSRLTLLGETKGQKVDVPGVVEKLKRQSLKRQQKQLTAQIAQAELEGNQARKKELLKMRQDLLKHNAV